MREKNNNTEGAEMNEIKTLQDVASLVDAGHDIALLSSVWQDGVQYLVMQDYTEHVHYSVAVA